MERLKCLWICDYDLFGRQGGDTYICMSEEDGFGAWEKAWKAEDKEREVADYGINELNSEDITDVIINMESKDMNVTDSARKFIRDIYGV